MVKRIIMMCSGVLLMGFGVTLFKLSLMGNDPFNGMNMGLAGVVGLTHGITQLIVNCLMLVVAVIFGRKYLHIGTVINMVFVGFLADFFTWAWGLCLPFPTGNDWVYRIVLLVFGVIALCLSCSLYLTPQLGIAPYDAVVFIVRDKTHLHFRWCRIILDVCCVAVMFLTGSIIGVGTVISALFTGPLISFFNKFVSEPLLGKDCPQLQEAAAE
ncbi:MAG: hypothetical protein HFE85_00200 [Clostridiales bacterium]|nr:hypothetical protein [Clostridiales bacterium]